MKKPAQEVKIVTTKMSNLCTLARAHISAGKASADLNWPEHAIKEIDSAIIVLTQIKDVIKVRR